MSEPAVNQQEGMKNKEVIARYFETFIVGTTDAQQF